MINKNSNSFKNNVKQNRIQCLLRYGMKKMFKNVLKNNATVRDISVSMQSSSYIVDSNLSKNLY